MHTANRLSLGHHAILRSPDLLSRLRDCTREQHARLDSGIDFRRGTVTRERYGAFLRGLLAVVPPLEAALTHWFPQATGASRSDCLRRDLEALGFSSHVAPARVRLPDDLPEAYGCAYVLEGSSLGGIALAPIVEEALGAGVPTFYLRLRGRDTGRAWRAWLDTLNAFGETASADEIDAACDMACATFAAYAESLSAGGAFVEEPAWTR